MDGKTTKYKITDYLQTLSVKEYRKAIRTLPKLLGISLNTFYNYTKIEIDDIQDIPYAKVVMMEKLFDLAPGSLMNYDFETTTFKGLKMVKTSGKKLDDNVVSICID